MSHIDELFESWFISKDNYSTSSVIDCEGMWFILILLAFRPISLPRILIQDNTKEKKDSSIETMCILNEMKKCIYNIDFQETNHIMSDNQHLVRKKYHVSLSVLLSSHEISRILKK